MSQDETDTTAVKRDSATTPPRRPALQVALMAVLAIGAISTAGLLVAKLQTPDRSGSGGATPQAPSKELKDLAAKHFPNWPADKKPELVIILTGEQHNYEQPCGCTEPQLGGLERRYNFIKFLRDQGLAVVPVDLGDVYYNHYEPGKPTQADQVKLKYTMSMNALSLMGYEAVCIGKEEFRIPLLDGLAETVLNNKPSYQILAANIKDRETNYPGNNGSMIGDFKVTNTPIKVGIVGAIGQSVIDDIAKIDANVKFDNNAVVIPAAVKAMNAQNPDVRLLLYQGSVDEAKKLAAKIPDFDVILCLSDQAEPPGEPIPHGNTRIIWVGHKGRFVGQLALFRKADGQLDYRYDLVPMSGDFRTPKEQAAENAGLKLLEDYTKKVRDEDLLSKYPQVSHPMQVRFSPANTPPQQMRPRYAGSQSCKECHQKEFEVWDGSKHAEAFDTLVNNKKPPVNRQFDGECVVCHTVGFGYVSGYRDEKRTPLLKGVGCENCHGPGSLHVAQPKDKDIQLAMSPWKRNPGDNISNDIIQKVIFKTCFHCHDTDNDPKFDLPKYWPKVGHGKNASFFKGAGAAAKKE